MWGRKKLAAMQAALKLLAAEIGFNLYLNSTQGTAHIEDRWTSLKARIDGLQHNLIQLEWQQAAILKALNLCVVHSPAQSATIKVVKCDEVVPE